MPKVVNTKYVKAFDVDALEYHPQNPNVGDGDAIRASIESNGFYGALVVQASTNYVLAGNHRLEAAIDAGYKTVPVVFVDVDDEQALKIMLADNRIGQLAEPDEELLAELLSDLAATDNLEGTGYDQIDVDEILAMAAQNIGGEGGQQKDLGSLARRYVVPPFSVLRMDSVDWQDRKRMWTERCMLNGDASREGAEAYSITVDYMHQETGVSIFNPVLAEIAYAWFAPSGAVVFDPFCGGNVRGVVAAAMGLKYTGCDVRKEQVQANKDCLGDAKYDGSVKWVHADSKSYAWRGKCDFIFTCPPYGDLEVYSKQPDDISNKTEKQFVELYAAILGNVCKRAKDDSFAGIVVGNYRRKDGTLVDMRTMTNNAMKAAGFTLYNDFICVTPVGTLPVRTGAHFDKGRKAGRQHQEFLVYVKGDPMKAAAKCVKTATEEETE